MTDVRQRPRARLNAAHHQAHVGLVWMLFLALVAGGISVSSGLTGTEKALGALTITAVVLVTTLAVLYLRRPVHHR